MDRKVYLPKIKNFYAKIIEKCERLYYCFDLTEKVLPDGNKYFDARHQNYRDN